MIKKKIVKGIRTVRDKIVYEGAIYHLTQRAPGKELLFVEENDYLHMLSLIKEISSKFKWRIFCFCLMPNHLHLLIQINERNLSEGAKNLFEKYANRFNKKYQRKGPVFCKPFRTTLCIDESYLLAVSVYIHLNPLKAGLVEDIEQYRWSSLNLYIKEDSPLAFVDYTFILNILSKDLMKAKKLYKELLNASMEIEYKSIYQDINALGKFRISLVKIKNLLSITTRGDKSWNLFQEIEKYKAIKGSKKTEDIKVKRYIIEQLIANGYKISEIASLLEVSREAIYKLNQKFRLTK